MPDEGIGESCDDVCTCRKIAIDDKNVTNYVTVTSKTCGQCDPELRYFGDDGRGQYCQMQHDNSYCNNKAYKAVHSGKYPFLKRGANSCLLQTSKPIFDDVKKRYELSPLKWLKCDLSRLTICVGENDPGPPGDNIDEPEISPFYDSSRSIRQCFENTQRITTKTGALLSDFLNLEENPAGEAAREIKESGKDK